MPGRVREDEDVDSKMAWQRSDLENNGPKNLNSHVTPTVNGIAHEKHSLADRKLNGQTPSHQLALDGPSPSRTTIEKPSSEAAMPQQNELPSEVEHITFGYQPISTLIGRLAQETFNNLHEVIDALAETPVPVPSYLGGVGSHAAVNGGDSNAAAQRKMRMMKFTQDRRAQFIKLLVLTQWSRQGADVSKVIDLRAWLERERAYYDEAWISLGEMKRSLAGAKIPNPDIKTALEALSAGKVSGMPDLGYIPPPPLTPQEMLKTLRNINTLLSIRLNLHEELPPQLRSFNIESGRVTFTVPDEFELDLSIADEDPSSQLFFIDFRFAFWPSSQETIDTRLLDDIDRKCNELLGTTGLRGCYQFLHEMVLTHKINILRRQAFEMSREWWSESIKLEMLRRTLVVQYWLGRVGPRHWIEIGISSGKRKTSRWTAGDEPTSEISVRWFVAGREVQDAPAIPLQLHHLSTERILKSYICTHITRILSSIRQRLLQIRSYGEHALAIELTTSETEPWDCQLKVELTASTSITVAVEPVSGKFALIPTSPLFARFEADMNNLRDPAADAHWLIFKLRCLSVINEVESSARAIGLQLWKTLSLKQDDFRRVFSRDTMRVLYLRRKEWNSEWILAMSVGPSGEAWWIMEILDAPIGWRVGHFQRLPVVSTSGRAIPLTGTFLLRLWTEAAGIIAQFANVRALASMGVRHAFRTDRVVTADATRSVPTLLIDFSSLLFGNSNGSNGDGGGSGDEEWNRWAKRALNVICQDASLDTGEVTLLVKGMLRRPEPTLNLASTGPDDAIAMDPDTGAFSFTIPVALGQPIIQRLRERLQRMERLLELMKVVRSFRLPCDSVTLGRIEVTYSAVPRLTAVVEFPGSRGADNTAPPITVDFAPGNPHIRIRKFLNAMLADKDGLANVLLYLAFTLPILLAFDEIEARSAKIPTTDPATSAMKNTASASASALISSSVSNHVATPTTVGAVASANQPMQRNTTHSANDHQPLPPDAAINTGLVILPHDVSWFRLEYERPQCTFDIRLRQWRDQVRWWVRVSLLSSSSSPSFSSTLFSAAPSSSSTPFSTPASTHNASTSPSSSSLIEPLRAFMRRGGPGWISLGNSIAADIRGAATVVRNLHALVRQHGVAVAVSAPPLPPPQPAPLTPPHRPLTAQQEQQQQQQQQQPRPALDRYPQQRAQLLKVQQQQQQQQQQRQQQHLQMHHPSPASHHPTPPSLPLPLPPQ